ncbi:MAG TPA: hypothetical protein VFB21_21755 [Chthonomonadaceae bacterium]|nr:hypothetical protein [Chthonomonadaceae bacterium]
MKKEVSRPLVIALVAVALVLVGVFGWLQLRSPAPDVTPEQTKAAQKSQMDMMKSAMQQMRKGQESR